MNDVALLVIVCCISLGLLVGFIFGVKSAFKRAIMVIDYALEKTSKEIEDMEFDDYVFRKSRCTERETTGAN